MVNVHRYGITNTNTISRERQKLDDRKEESSGEIKTTDNATAVDKKRTVELYREE